MIYVKEIKMIFKEKEVSKWIEVKIMVVIGTKIKTEISHNLTQEEETKLMIEIIEEIDIIRIMVEVEEVVNFSKEIPSKETEMVIMQINTRDRVEEIEEMIDLKNMIEMIDTKTDKKDLIEMKDLKEMRDLTEIKETIELKEVIEVIDTIDKIEIQKTILIEDIKMKNNPTKVTDMKIK